MKLYVLSDIHDNVWALERALKEMDSNNNHLLFLGDFCAPFTLVQLAEEFSGPIHIVWGNNDGDRWLLTEQASNFHHVSLHGEMAEICIESSIIKASHYPEVAKSFAEAGGVNLVCYGHDHRFNDRVLKDGTILLNPGEIMGRFGSSTFVEVELSTMTRKIIEV